VARTGAFNIEQGTSAIEGLAILRRRRRRGFPIAANVSIERNARYLRRV
jgi:hypothetical protein